MTFTRSDVYRSFNTVFLERGMDLVKQGSVVSLNDQADSLEGVVSGPREEARVEVFWSQRGRVRQLAGRCTCPMEENCKHVAAVCLKRLQEMEAAPGGSAEEASESDPPLRSSRPGSGRSLPAQLQAWLTKVEKAISRPAPPKEASHRVVYLLRNLEGALALTVTIGYQNTATEVVKAYPKGSLPPRGVKESETPEDADLKERLQSFCRETGFTTLEYSLRGQSGASLLREVVATGRAYFDSVVVEGVAEPQPVSFSWEAGEDGRLRLMAKAGESAFPVADLIRLEPPMWFDARSRLLVPLETSLPPKALEALSSAPPVKMEDAGVLRARLIELGLPESLAPDAGVEVRLIEGPPTPVLRCDVRLASYEGYFSRHPKIQQWIPYATLAFSYQGRFLNKDQKEEREHENGVLTVIRRDEDFEKECERKLHSSAWSTSFGEWRGLPKRYNAFALLPDNWVDAAHLARYVRWLKEDLPGLQSEGWDIEVAGPWTIDDGADLEWGLTVKEGPEGARARLTGKVRGKAIDMASLLTKLRAMGAERKTGPQPPVLLQAGEGTMILLSPTRLAQALRTLTAILGDGVTVGEEAYLRRSDLGDLAALEEEGIKTWVAPSIKTLAQNLASHTTIPPLEPSPGFGATLRPYQKEGLGWMNFLKENDFHGILADDMGLGKTVQVLALIHREKAEGRLGKPALVVSPTSVLPNWKREAGRFAPGLKVGVLHGAQRDEVLARASDHDLLLTTYPLLARDRESLKGAQFSMVFADEAQAVKNPATASSKALRSLEADFRMALSGTPIENHLGELWSLFSFLMPGFLGSQALFQKTYRAASPDSRKALARKVRPFLLRRTREQVLDELPPRVEIIERVEMEESQQRLYDEVSLVADKAVREILAAKGLQAGRFQILEALLRLRQICLDPRLAPQKGEGPPPEPGAKIARMMEMLEILLSEGRQVLVFSQFTSFLDLVEEALAGQGWTWTTLRGDTKDRAAPVEAFQNGEASIFLVSLKAGGSGLNLTAADTVLLCDPWWNPAVEDQAMGRAHRMGQTRAVTVYRLIAAGTVEERMLELQEHKKDLASSITDEAALGSLTAEEFLFALSGEKGQAPPP